MPKKIEFKTGEQYHDYTVLHQAPSRNGRIYWLCQCICGKQEELRADAVKVKKNCGCKKGLDLTGQQFGYLTAIKKTEKKNGTNNVWLFKCICGAEIELNTSEIKNRQKLSCGCQPPENIKNLVGQKFGKLTVLGYTSKRAKEGSVIWKCQCECGTICEIPTYNLITHHTTSCGCKMSEVLKQLHSKKYKGEKQIAKILTENNIKYEQQKTFPYLKDINSLFYDFYLPDYNCVIEYDGQQHFQYIPFFYKDEEAFNKVKEHDKIKNKYCFDNNISIIRIPYYIKDISLEKRLNMINLA